MTKVPPILFDWNRTSSFVSWSAQLSEALRQALEEGSASLVDQSVTLPYDYWTAGNYAVVLIDKLNAECSISDQILQAILPDELCDESPVSFAAVGHIGASRLRTPFF